MSNSAGRKKERETTTRALFVEKPQTRIGGETTKVIRSALKRRHSSNGNSGDETSAMVSSPLLSSTPPTISKTLVKLYPYLIVVDQWLSVITWTSDNIWSSILMVAVYTTGVLYFQTLAKYFGHLIAVAILWGYSLLDSFVEENMGLYPTLDDIIHVMNRVTEKSDMLFSPITILSAQDIRKLFLTTVFLSPLYVLVAAFILPPRKLLLLAGLYVLTYQSPWSKVTRRLLWKFKVVRLLVFYLTGLNLGGINKHQGILATVHKKVKKLSNTNDEDASSTKPIRFTYVLYENQRRWIGIGWTASMLSYERTAWTDEFLNEAPSPDKFCLPEESLGMTWKWVDKNWRLDMTNDGAIQLSSNKPKTLSSPNADDGFIYYDNTWKKPSTTDSFSKYTRRRRWIRTAELLRTPDTDDDQTPELGSPEHISDIADSQESKTRTVQINEKPIVFGEKSNKKAEGTVSKDELDTGAKHDIIEDIKPNDATVLVQDTEVVEAAEKTENEKTI